MEHRYLKIALSLAVGLLASIWFLNNLLNWPVALGAVEYTLSQQDQQGYPVHLIPPLEYPLVSWAVLVLICSGEAVAGALALFGAYSMWASRGSDPVTFVAAKRYAVIGCGIAVLVWFLLFQVLGGALVLMGQSEGARGALEGAFRFAAYCFFTLIYLSLPEPPPRTE